MITFIVIFITLSLMGSALWILPSKNERRRMALRMQARKLNLVVQLTSIDLPDKWDKSLNTHKVCGYSLYRPKAIATFPEKVWLLPYEVWKYHSLLEGWWASKAFTLDEESGAILKNCGALLVAIKIAPEAVTFYWNEAGDETQLEQLKTLLVSLSAVDFSITT
ncbi:hypothetical protein [Marinomonas transparens]|uniref:Uncharacterized protein n=1 Tax=Marinomonas transparens TaxID=2795388 RepID=A0A934JW53_9GAMM|nr:hypothetical protein [Marinomonas transparens]MBJ7539481.1 hypothetical protein [Marinomonas transparens]